MTEGYGWSPDPGQSPGPATQDERSWATVAHVGAIVAAIVAMAFLAPLLVMLFKGNQSPFVRRHAVESLNFQITLLILLAVGFVLSIVTLGLGLVVVLPAGLVIGVLALVWIVRASMRANNGEDYRYPLNIRLVH